jgi:hypothetical protein
MPRRRPAVKFIRWLAKPSRPDTAGRPGRQKKFKKSASAFAGETNQVVGKVIPLVSFTRNWFSKEKKQCEPTLPLFFARWAESEQEPQDRRTPKERRGVFVSFVAFCKSHTFCAFPGMRRCLLILLFLRAYPGVRAQIFASSLGSNEVFAYDAQTGQLIGAGDQSMSASILRLLRLLPLSPDPLVTNKSVLLAGAYCLTTLRQWTSLTRRSRRPSQ